MKYVVTGSAGFIGGALTKRLKMQGHEIIGIDPADGSGDILDFDDLAKKARGADGIFHLGAIASVPRTIEDPKNSHAVNVTGTLNVLEAARVDGNIPVVYASSAAVYGDNDALPLSESETPRPLSPYAAHKIANEIDAKSFGAAYGLKTFGLRFFNIYGPGQDPSSPYSGVISIFHDRLRARAPVTLFGDGGQTRDFVALDDAMQSLIIAMENVSDSAPVANICTGTAISLRDLLDSFGQVMDATPEIQTAPPRAGDIKYSYGSPALFAKLTGFTPQTPLSEGLKALIKAA